MARQSALETSAWREKVILRWLAGALSLAIALYGAPDLHAEVVSPAVNAAFARITPALAAPLSASSPLLASPAGALRTPASLIAPRPAAPKAESPLRDAKTLPARAVATTPDKAIPSPREHRILHHARQDALALVEDVPQAPNTLDEAPISETPVRNYTPSPEDWRDELLHSMLLDRFARSGNIRTHGDVAKGDSRHGGNLRGAIEQLDYLKEAGVTTLILSPVTQNRPDSYHGYAPVHLMAIDPHLGTMADFKELVDQAHKRGMKVVFDLVINHSGPVFEYKEGSRWEGLDGPPKEIGEWTETLKPLDLKDPKHFTRRGVIDDWNNHQQAVNGDFPPNYRHYATSNKDTQEILLHIAKWWIQETDIDGFRLDAVRHLAEGFAPLFSKTIKEYASSIGKKNFFLLGENSTGRDSDLTPHMTKDGLDSVYAYPAYRRENYALHGKAAPRVLEESLNQTRQVLGPLGDRLLRFIDNHDVYRFLRLGEPEGQLKVALAYLLFSVGIPMTYYGTEQGFRQDTNRFDPENPTHPADPQNREDQFGDGSYKSESSRGDKFDRSNPIFQFFKQIAAVRKAYAALRRGSQWIRWADMNGAGIFAFSRIHNGQEIVVVLNFSNETRQEDMWVDATLSPAGTVFRDVLDQSYVSSAHTPVASGSKITVSVPPLSVRVLTHGAD
ncbi:MAG: alpha-amylase family glycosyl hydrolase [Elusimicrobiota bacterium]